MSIVTLHLEANGCMHNGDAAFFFFFSRDSQVNIVQGSAEAKSGLCIFTS